MPSFTFGKHSHFKAESINALKYPLIDTTVDLYTSISSWPLVSDWQSRVFVTIENHICIIGGIPQNNSLFNITWVYYAITRVIKYKYKLP